MLSIRYMLIKGSNNGLIKVLCPKLFPSGVVRLQHADDALLFLEKSNRTPINLK
jgi:hypothetical protein